jgi:hypothetical protein
MSPCPHGVALVVLVALAGCKIYGGEKKGESGRLGFYEPNDYAADQTTSGVGFERPIALGARADAWVLSPGISSLASATVDDSAIVSVSLAIYPIVLRGLAEGTTTLRVSTSSASDSLALTVVRPDGARLWTPKVETLSFAVPDSFFGMGAALRAGASVSVAAEPLAGTRPLLGFDLFQWSVVPPLLSHAPDGPTVNRQRFTALGMGGVATVSTQLGGSFQIVTLSNSEVPALKIYRAAIPPSRPTAITALEPQDLEGFFLGANDAAGHYVVPSPQDDAQFAVEVASGSVVLREAKLSSRHVSLRACAGSGSLRIRYLGAELLLPVEVTAAVADPACP